MTEQQQIEKLQAENQRLREALYSIAAPHFDVATTGSLEQSDLIEMVCTDTNTARAALKDPGGV